MKILIRDNGDAIEIQKDGVPVCEFDGGNEPMEELLLALRALGLDVELECD